MIVPVVPFNPVVMILHNQSTNRWHPIVLWECPPSSGELGEGVRWKSKGHHAKGFDTREEAINSEDAGVMNSCKRSHKHKQGGDVYYDTSVDIEWDGKEMPAMVMSFDLSKLNRFEPVEESVDPAVPVPG